MGAVGLIYVGAVLFLNGVMLLGWVESRSAAPLNLFVGVLQVITPTYLIFTADGDLPTILAASGIYLFGFTYLYVGINLLAGLDGTGLGYFSLFVAVCALIYSGLNFFVGADPGFGVIWLYWSFLWLLFFAARPEDGRPGPLHRSGNSDTRVGHRRDTSVPPTYKPMGAADHGRRRGSCRLRNHRFRHPLHTYAPGSRGTSTWSKRAGRRRQPSMIDTKPQTPRQDRVSAQHRMTSTSRSTPRARTSKGRGRALPGAVAAARP